MTTDNFCFYLQNRLIQTNQTGGQWYSDTSPFSIPWIQQSNPELLSGSNRRGLERGHVPGHRVAGRPPGWNDLLALLHHPHPLRQLHPAQRLLGHRRRQLGVGVIKRFFLRRRQKG
jgi:hypothetical protein